MLSRAKLLEMIEQAGRQGALTLDLSARGIEELPEEIGHLTELRTLNLSNNRLASLPAAMNKLTRLESLRLSGNNFTEVPSFITTITSLESLELDVQLNALPEDIGALHNLYLLSFGGMQIAELPQSFSNLTKLQALIVYNTSLKLIPDYFKYFSLLRMLYWTGTNLTTVPEWIDQLPALSTLYLAHNELIALPPALGNLAQLRNLSVSDNRIENLLVEIGGLANLEAIDLAGNQLSELPQTFLQLTNLKSLDLDNNPLNPALQSAYEGGLDAVMAYLRSLEEPDKREELYEARLILVGEGGVGKTSLLKALTGRQPRVNEPTTHGVSIAREPMHLPHPDRPGVRMQLNAWDFGGQEVYRVTHQFFFSKRSVYLLLWEPRLGVQQCLVEDWLRMIKLRVGEDARVIIVSTHARTGGHIARIDKPVLTRDFGSMIVDFVEVDSLVEDPATGDKVGVAELKELIRQTAAGLQQMGMEFNRDWREARDELLALPDARIAYERFAEVCAAHGLDAISARTLAELMHDLGYSVYYGDDERLKDEVILKPEWLTKAIGFVLEDRTTQEMDGILPDSRLREVWLEHPFPGEPTYGPELYPFFLRLMEKYDVSYRLQSGNASLIAQHVPQVRPPLPWLETEEPAPDLRRNAMVCVMEESPPGLVPWMIVRTHEYAYEERGPDGKTHRLHWQKGMFLRYRSHGQALLELRDRELHLYVEALWPTFFMNELDRILQKLISDNWPGLKDRYLFAVPCPEQHNGAPCAGRFNIEAMREFLEEGDETYRCQVCRKRHNIVELLYGFEEQDTREQLAELEATISQRIDEVLSGMRGLESRVANSFMNVMHAIASESKDGPRLFTIEPDGGNWRRPLAGQYRLRLWCEAEGCQHPIFDEGKGVYVFKQTREWLARVAPYANLIAGLLKTILPLVGPAVESYFGDKTLESWGVEDYLDLSKEGVSGLVKEIGVLDHERVRQGMLSEAERSGILALHSLLRELDPHHQQLGLTRIPTYTGGYRWLCHKHYQESQPKIPDTIE